MVKIKKRFNKTNTPKIKVIDMRKSRSRLISEKLEYELNKNIEERKQSLILINRRGYAPVSLCVNCGIKRNYRYCDTSLVYHKESNVLMCHQCGKKQPLEGECKECNSNKFILVGTGIRKSI